MRKKVVEKHNPVLEKIRNVYKPLLILAMDNPKLTLLYSISALAASLCLLQFLGSEFIPSLDEGSILLRTKLSPSVAHTESMRISTTVEKMIKEFTPYATRL